jgi:hypothetical protein
MNRRTVMTAGLALAALAAAGCAHVGDSGWVTLIDGEKGLENFNRIGNANWRAEGGAIVADKGKGGYLVTKNSYKDFQIRAEFWANETSQSGIFFRISDPNKIGAASAYEANIYDQRPGAEYSTGAIVNFAMVPVPPIYKMRGTWHTYEITARGSELTLVLDGVVTANIRNDAYKQGPFALQFGNRGKLPGGTIKWRKVQVRTL